MPLALSVWWCGPTGLAARAEHGNRWHRYISLQLSCEKFLRERCVCTRFRAGAVSWARFSAQRL